MKTQYDITRDVDLSRIIGISYIEYCNIIKNINDEYTTLEVKKKNGGTRNIAIPSPRLDYCQRFFLNILKENEISPCVHGFVSGKGIRSNIEMHINSNFLLTVDIKNFFQTFRVEDVYLYFVKLGFSNAISYKISKLLTYKGVLPQGVCSSPILSNLLFKDVDEEILRISESENIIYSRYADDMCFSSNIPIGVNFYKEIEKKIKEFGFQLNKNKTRSYDIKYYLEINGIKVFDINGNRKLKVRRKYVKKIKTELYFIEKYGLDAHKKRVNDKENYSKERINGKICYIKQFDIEKANELFNIFNRIDW